MAGSPGDFAGRKIEWTENLAVHGSSQALCNIFAIDCIIS